MAAACSGVVDLDAVSKSSPTIAKVASPRLDHLDRERIRRSRRFDREVLHGPRWQGPHGARRTRGNQPSADPCQSVGSTIRALARERPSIEECDHKNARRVQSPLPTEPGKVEQLWPAGSIAAPSGCWLHGSCLSDARLVRRCQTAPLGVTAGSRRCRRTGANATFAPPPRARRSEPGQRGDCWATVELAANAPSVGRGEPASPLGRRQYGHPLWLNHAVRGTRSGGGGIRTHE
jgi:hypothetical protein